MAPLDAMKGGHGLPPMDRMPTTAARLKTVKPLRVAGVLIDLFTRVGQRDPPSATKTKHARLVSIAVSNYVEKARWGMDLLEAHSKSPLYYTEDLHPPAFASFQTVKASNDQASQCPMLVVDGQCTWGSEAILQELCADSETVDLYPKESQSEIIAVEAELGARLGATARCFGYHCLLDESKRNYEAAKKFLTLHCPKVEQKIFANMLDRGLDRGMMQAMQVKEYGPMSEGEIRRVFDDMSHRLEKNGGEYLVGQEFTAADLSLAALSYFLLRPPEMKDFLLDEVETPLPMMMLGLDLRQTPAGQHVLRMYEEHRPINEATGAIEIKKVDQDRTPWMEMAGAATALGAVGFGISSLR